MPRFSKRATSEGCDLKAGVGHELSEIFAGWRRRSVAGCGGHSGERAGGQEVSSWCTAAWVDASGWKPVYDILKREGFNVTMVQEPETSFADDVTAAKRVLDHTGRARRFWSAIAMAARSSLRPVSIRMLIGLVYVAAHAPDVGEDEAALGKKMPSVLAKTDGAIKVTTDGLHLSEPGRISRSCSHRICRVSGPNLSRSSQVLAATSVFTYPADSRGLEDEAELGIVAGNDQIINPDLERFYYARAKSKTIEIPGASHSVYGSHPREVAAFITEAARTVRSRAAAFN